MTAIIVAWALIVPLAVLVVLGRRRGNRGDLRWLDHPAYYLAGAVILLGLFLLQRLTHDWFAWVSLGFIGLYLASAWECAHRVEP